MQTNATMCPVDQVGGSGVVPPFRTQLKDVVDLIVGDCCGNVAGGGTTRRVEAGGLVVKGGGRGEEEKEKKTESDLH